MPPKKNNWILALAGCYSALPVWNAATENIPPAVMLTFSWIQWASIGVNMIFAAGFTIAALRYGVNVGMLTHVPPTK